VRFAPPILQTVRTQVSSVIKNLASIVIGCVQSVSTDAEGPKGWMKTVVKISETMVRALDIYSECRPVYDMIVSRSIHWFSLGGMLGKCAKASILPSPSHHPTLPPCVPLCLFFLGKFNFLNLCCLILRCWRWLTSTRPACYFSRCN